ncbi:hypothetical protein PHJA_002099300 [Phtheirospermum japonicum]|uniref:Protein BIG GRAIN 1-like B n=1 Tax=Phtheirospermum japonicum TaxID=374723 RepID=A0A830CMU0_9LAMI|nr:hypothetical protein PHJA_002099300 [Phtheirospermum japonicum]
MPSFSSTLLDEIYRSIDGGAEKSEDFKAYREKLVKKQSGHRAAKTNIIEDEETRNFRRACLVEKWMEKEKNGKPVPKKCPDSELDSKSSLQDNNDVLFFSSTSSSNSDSSGALSSSDTEFFGPQTKPKVSCFAPRPKPVRTGAPAHGNKSNPQEDFSLFGDYQNNEKNKSRALKLYANLKKVKQPISPGGRLTSFINSLFNNTNGKRSKNNDFNDSKSPKTQSACSSATSFSRSCLSKYSQGSRERMRDGAQRTVRFHPVSVIVDEDLRPCGQRRIYEEDSDKYGKPPLPIRGQVALADLELRKMEKNRRVVEEGARNDFKGYNSKRSDDYSVFRKIDGGEDEDDDYDGMSDSSSDLFELDHLSLFGSNRFCEELPVYETTRLDTNRAIASRLIR